VESKSIVIVKGVPEVTELSQKFWLLVSMLPVSVQRIGVASAEPESSAPAAMMRAVIVVFILVLF
jgi:hypothetical protein